MSNPSVGRSLTDQGFGEDQAPEKSGPRPPILDKSELVHGVVVKYLKSDRKTHRNDSSRWSMLHTFQMPVKFGAGQFQLWGSTQLDQKLRGVKLGTVVVLRFDGRDEATEAEPNQPFKWLVRPFKGNHAELKNIIDQEWTRQSEMLVVAISAAVEREKAGRGDSGTPAGDDDLPF